MNLQGLEAGTRLVTASGDSVELLEVYEQGESALVRYVDVLAGANATTGREETIEGDDVITVDGNRFIGPGRTSSSSRAP